MTWEEWRLVGAQVEVEVDLSRQVDGAPRRQKRRKKGLYSLHLGTTA